MSSDLTFSTQCKNCHWDVTLLYQQKKNIHCPRCGCGLFDNLSKQRGMTAPIYDRQGQPDVQKLGGNRVISEHN